MPRAYFNVSPPQTSGAARIFSYYLMPRTGFEPESVELHPEQKASIQDALPKAVLNLLFFLFSSTSPIRALISLTPKDDMARIFPPNSFSATGNQTHVSSVALL